MPDKFDIADALSRAAKTLEYSQSELAQAERTYEEAASELKLRSKRVEKYRRIVALDGLVIDAILQLQPEEPTEVMKQEWKIE